MNDEQFPIILLFHYSTEYSYTSYTSECERQWNWDYVRSIQLFENINVDIKRPVNENCTANPMYGMEWIEVNVMLCIQFSIISLKYKNGNFSTFYPYFHFPYCVVSDDTDPCKDFSRLLVLAHRDRNEIVIVFILLR